MGRMRLLWRSPRAVVRAMIVGGTLLALAAPAVAAPSDPPGANGTIKIDGVPFDTHPNNQPHVGCVFEVDFYGFDRGNFFAGVSFALHPPSGRAVLLVDNSVFIGGDRAGGGTDLDAEREYDLNLLVPRSGLHPKQGWHIKVTVVAPGVGGKLAKKTKVFWVRDCIDP